MQPERGGTVDLAGVAIDIVTIADVCERTVQAAAAGQGGVIVTPNLDHLRRLQGADPMAEVYARASMVLADGMPLVWASRLKGAPLPARVAGSDLLWALSLAAADAGISVALVGGTPGAAEVAADRLRERAPALDVAFTACPTVSVPPRPGELDDVVKLIETFRPDVVFTALGSPKQELVNGVLADHFPATWFLGVGAAVDMAAGTIHRAPRWLQRAGLEWCYRLAQEPRRLARRYLVEDAPFALRLLGHAALERLRSPAVADEG